jgi:hypothetical protein
MITVDYLTLHAELIAQRATVTGAGAKASISRKIGQTEMELGLLGIEYKPFAPESQSVASLADKSDAELTAMHTDAIKVRTDATTSGHKAQGTIAIRRIEKAMSDRSMTFDVWKGNGSPSPFSDQELIGRIAGLRRLIASPTCRTKIKVIAERELDALESTATFKGLIIPVADAPVASPPVSGGDALDAVTAAPDDATADADAVASLDSRKRGRKSVAA